MVSLVGLRLRRGEYVGSTGLSDLGPTGIQREDPVLGNPGGTFGIQREALDTLDITVDDGLASWTLNTWDPQVVHILGSFFVVSFE